MGIWGDAVDFGKSVISAPGKAISGAGGTTKTSLKVTNESVSNVALRSIQRSVQNCQASNSQVQSLSARTRKGTNFLWGNSLKQEASISLSCVFESSKRAEIKTNIINDLLNQIKVSTEGAFSPLTKTETETNIRNTVKTSFSQTLENTDEQNTVASSVQAQSVSANTTYGNNIIVATSLEQSAKIVAQSILRTDSVQQAITDVVNNLENENVVITETKPLIDFGAATAIFFLIVVVIIGFIIYKFSGASGGNESAEEMSIGGLDFFMPMNA